jgi:hypothetical protein
MAITLFFIRRGGYITSVDSLPSFGRLEWPGEVGKIINAGFFAEVPTISVQQRD